MPDNTRKIHPAIPRCIEGLIDLLGMLAVTPLGKHAQEIYKAFDASGHGGVDFSGIIQHVRAGKTS